MRKNAWKLMEIVLIIFFAFPIFLNLVGSFISKDVIQEAFLDLEMGKFVNFNDFIGALSLEQYKIILFMTPNYLMRFWNSILQ